MSEELAVADELLESGNLPGIIEPESFQVPAIENPYDDEFANFSSALFIPRLQLEGSNSRLVKARKVPAGNWIVVNSKELQIVGEEADILVLCHRVKALDLTNKAKPIASFDPKSDEFKRIQGGAQQKVKSLMYGLEFLVWVPDYTPDNKFATMFMGNPTGRVAAKNLKPLMKRFNPKANNHVHLKWEMLHNDEYDWEAPIFLKCSSALKNYPSQSEMLSQMTSFLDPPKGLVREQVSESEAEAAGMTDSDGEAEGERAR